MNLVQMCCTAQRVNNSKQEISTLHATEAKNVYKCLSDREALASYIVSLLFELRF